MAGVSAADHRKRGLDVLWHVWANEGACGCDGSYRTSAGRWRMYADEGGKNFYDRRMIDDRVTHDALKRVDGPEADIHFVSAGLTKLLDSLGEAISDLPRSGEVLLLASGLLLMPVGRVRDEEANGKDDHREDVANGKESLPGIGLEIERCDRGNLKPGCPYGASSKPPGGGLACAATGEAGAARR
ncbi:hypothetical protein [Micromonospora viridifaciens]|uniref:hypothetical protein n=1 Tax=Micromonospora viridifaciens TaxID=1881 RepID=UPI001E6236FF|nr:hypothetical protein [Micromonospora viridifaciens]